MREGMLYSESSRKNLSCGAGESSGKPRSAECVSGWQERLWESLVAFEAVQMDHRRAFASGRYDNLMARRAEREKAWAHLQMALEAAQNKLLVGENRAFATRVQAKLSDLIDLETVLAEGAHKVRKQMLDELAAIRQGRRVLKGYGQHHDGAPRPRLLNSKT
jgi:hypothetical protein